MKTKEENRIYCRKWHENNRERSRELAREYYQRISKPIKPLKSFEEVTLTLNKFPEHFLNDFDLFLWSRKHWKVFKKLEDASI